ncbi:MOSC domain-containing protein [Phenylobacterium immobile]|uniref:MOSC domain-containing protein n=1 Tax=Phenylobacterium immobile TaxID=21 RepID=UPI000ADB4466|nr:MOSC domain-containing protein [Phenylobacterium immobile]
MSAFNPSSTLQRLLDAPVRPGRLAWIGLRTERRGGIEIVDAVRCSPDQGLIGDRYGGRTDLAGQGGKRQVTLIAAEDLAAVARFLDRPEPALPPELVRRNLVVEGLNLTALKGRHLAVGDDVLLEITGECHPCSRMEEVLGEGGYNALRGRGGLTARVLGGGQARVGDVVRRV